ncbi:MAG: hypothetical protein JWR75_20 [Devosia sp.]|nr:hypothetical protein [Devosia sp.]
MSDENPKLLPESVKETVEFWRGGLAGGRHVQVINFHATPSYRRDEYRRQLEACARYYEPMSLTDLDDFFAGNWTKPKPGLIPVVFEGFRDGIDVMLPILEEFGFIGWYFIPSIFPGLPVAEQRPFAASHHLWPAKTEEYSGERMTLSWDEARAIADKHVFACHSRTHNFITPDSTEALLQDEIVTSTAEFVAGIGRRPEVFAWLYGTQTGVNPRSDELLRQQGYKYLYSNTKIQKLQ